MAPRTSRVRRRRRSGYTLIDALFGTLIASIAIFGFVSLCVVMFRMTDNHRQLSIAYSLARYNLERLKGSGFAYATEGTSTKYYDAFGTNESTSTFSSATYKVDTSVTSSVLKVDGVTPDDTALRTVTVTVTAYPAGTVLQKWGTLLTKGGA